MMWLTKPRLTYFLADSFGKDYQRFVHNFEICNKGKTIQVVGLHPNGIFIDVKYKVIKRSKYRLDSVNANKLKRLKDKAHKILDTIESIEKGGE